MKAINAYHNKCLSTSSNRSTLIFGKYLILNKIGHGSFGQVFKGQDIRTNEIVALKFENLSEDKKQFLENEAYSLINNKGFGIPKVKSFGIYHKQNVLVQEYLGKNLEEIYNRCNRHFSLKDICMLMYQSIERIEFIHKNGYIHRDIKPSNFVLSDINKNIIYLIDFGVCKKYKSSRTNKHVQFRITGKLIGSVLYSSLNSFLGTEQSRRDDLISLSYMLIYFLTGTLPWKDETYNELNKTTYLKIFQKKKDLDTKMLLKGFPNEFLDFVNYTTRLTFKQNPDYNYMKGLFYSLIEKMGEKFDYDFSWSPIKKNESQYELSPYNSGNLNKYVTLNTDNNENNYIDNRKSYNLASRRRKKTLHQRLLEKIMKPNESVLNSISSFDFTYNTSNYNSPKNEIFKFKSNLKRIQTNN